MMRRALYGAAEMICGIKGCVSEALNCADPSYNNKSYKMRAGVPHTFEVIKLPWAEERAQIYTWMTRDAIPYDCGTARPQCHGPGAPDLPIGSVTEFQAHFNAFL